MPPKKTAAKTKKVDMKVPPGDIVSPFAGDINKLEVPVARGEAIAEPTMRFNQLGKVLEPGTYQVKQGYFIKVIYISGETISMQKGHLQPSGMISWSPEYKAQTDMIYKFIKNNLRDNPKSDAVQPAGKE